MTLYEYILIFINPQLLNDIKDPLINYESFYNKVANSALI